MFKLLEKVIVPEFYGEDEYFYVANRSSLNEECYILQFINSPDECRVVHQQFMKRVENA